MARSRKTQEKDVISRLADAGEEALHRIGDLPGGKSMLKTMNDIRGRLDDVAVKLRKLDPLERRVSSIEKRLDALDKPRAAPAARRRTTARPKRSSSST
ncbi:MAG TPA: hypothetical protein VLJ76_05345 [Gaiellaceae bacterium]|nr:hypothetical protein [Gaiellaceae bacterium]